MVHSVAQNLDLRYEWFPKGIDQVLAGVFYKNIANPIEYQIVPAGISSAVIQPVNVTGSPAVNYGAELQVTKYIHYFGVSLNYTYTHSSITDKVNSFISNPSLPGATTTLYNISETRPLQGQAAHIANVSFLYKNPKNGFDAHLAWNYTGRHIAFLYNFVGLDYWQDATSFFDFACEKRIAKGLSLFAKINNLLNASTIQSVILRRSYLSLLIIINY